MNNDPDPENPLEGLLDFLTAAIEDEAERKTKAVADRVGELSQRELKLVHESSTIGYLLGYTDRHAGQVGMTDSRQLTARVMGMALDEAASYATLGGARAVKCPGCGDMVDFNQIEKIEPEMWEFTKCDPRVPPSVSGFRAPCGCELIGYTFKIDLATGRVTIQDPKGNPVD